ncbi:oxidoreductase-like domain-containing protein 1 [Ochotona curzoniae]|uniref:oxidoreductase-like domain-containing protein 1 n=1 Tax=Ochotona curzoniae TaxID=130825 RepID=UPI001B34F489|nr:oxidoreductase-like domain-containing protein 1 [Ochotona curzoniae]
MVSGARWLSRWTSCQRLPPQLARWPAHDGHRTLGTDPVQKDEPGKPSVEAPDALPPDLQPPVNCCMSGCPTCVWVDYAQRLLQHYEDGGARALATLEQHVADQNLKAFLRLEIQLRMSAAPCPPKT